MFKIRRSWDRLIFNMGIPIPGKDSLYIETGPWCFPVACSSGLLHVVLSHCSCMWCGLFWLMTVYPACGSRLPDTLGLLGRPGWNNREASKQGGEMHDYIISAAAYQLHFIFHPRLLLTPMSNVSCICRSICWPTALNDVTTLILNESRISAWNLALMCYELRK